MIVWRTRNADGTRAIGQCFNSFSDSFHECFNITKRDGVLFYFYLFIYFFFKQKHPKENNKQHDCDIVFNQWGTYFLWAVFLTFCGVVILRVKTHNWLQNYRYQVAARVLSQTTISCAFMNSLESTGRMFCETCLWMTRPLEIWKRTTSTVRLLKSATKGFWNGKRILAPRKRRLKDCATPCREWGA